MSRFIIRRLLFSILSLLGATVVLFSLSRMAGDPRYVILGQPGYVISEEQWEKMGKEMGLDKPKPVQYVIYVGKLLTGDWGRTLIGRMNVRDRITARIRATVQLGLVAWVAATVIGIPLGILSAVSRGTVWDYVGRGTALIGQATPTFWVGIVFMWIFAVKLGWVPSSGTGDWRHFILPAVTLAMLPLAGYTRLTRSAMLEVLDSEYVKLARAKGVGRMAVIWKHAFRNALLAPLTFSGLLLAGLINGSAVVETVFAWPGLGRLAVSAVHNNDFNLMSGVVVIFTVLFVGTSFIVDMIYLMVDPRIKYT